MPSAWRLIAPAYPVLKTWKKHPGRRWRSLLFAAIEQLCTEDIRIQSFHPEWICPVPQGPGRMGNRLSSPSAEVAWLFSRALKIPICTALVIEKSSQHPLRQAERDGWERRHLPFAWKIELTPRAQPGRYLLVDDFVTSGRTLHHCAAVLNQREGVAVLTAALGSRLISTTSGNSCPCGTQPCACIA